MRGRAEDRFDFYVDPDEGASAEEALGTSAPELRSRRVSGRSATAVAALTAICLVGTSALIRAGGRPGGGPNARGGSSRRPAQVLEVGRPAAGVRTADRRAPAAGRRAGQTLIGPGHLRTRPVSSGAASASAWYPVLGGQSSASSAGCGAQAEFGFEACER